MYFTRSLSCILYAQLALLKVNAFQVVIRNKVEAITFIPRSNLSVLSCSSSSDNENQNGEASSKEKVLDQIISYIKSPTDQVEGVQSSLSYDEVTSMIEATFVKACLQLATGYVDVLKLFIVSVQASYNLKLSLSEILQRLELYPTQTANRPLLGEEVRLRKIWITCIYLTLDLVEHKSIDGLQLEGLSEKYASLVEQVVSRKEEGVASSPSLFNIDKFIDESNGEFSSDKMEKAIISHTVRIIYLTLAVLEEVKDCDDQVNGRKGKRLVGGPPRPPIPGTY